MSNQIKAKAAPAQTPIYLRHLRDVVESVGGTMEQDNGGRFEVWQCCAAYGQVWKCGSKHIRLEWQPGVSTSREARQQAIVEALECVKCGVRDMTPGERLECDEPAPAPVGGWTLDTATGRIYERGEWCATIQSGGAATRLVDSANSAPALLAALRNLVECPDYRNIQTHEMDQARAAIAQAERGDK